MRRIGHCPNPCYRSTMFMEITESHNLPSHFSNVRKKEATRYGLFFSIDKSACNISQFAIFQNFHHNLLGFGFKNMRSPQNKPVGGTIIFNGTTISRFSLFNSVFYWKSKLIYYYHKIIFLSLFRFRPSLPHRRKSGARNLNSLFSYRSLYGQAWISACAEMTFYIV